MATQVKQLGGIGERMDLLIRQGGTLGPFVATMKNPDLSLVDLSGCLIRGQIRKTASSATVTATIDVDSPYDDTGRYMFGLSSSITAAISAGADINHPDSQYAWDLEMVDSVGQVIPLYWGVARVHREVTRD